MRLPRTITLPARNTLMALPYWPEPPERLAIVLDAVVDDDGAVVAGLPRQTWMPLLPAPAMVLRAISSAARIERVDRDVGAVGDRACR